MKRLLPVRPATAFLLLLLVLGFASCNVEKRLYRPGWYTGHHRQKQAPAAEKESAVKDDPQPATCNTHPADTSDVEKSVPATTTTVSTPATPESASTTVTEKEAPASANKSVLSRPPDEKPISYAEARRRMAEQGCTPHPFAITVYWLSIASIALIWFGFGLLTALIVFILSTFAIDAVIASGSCVDENIAIIKAARRMLAITLLIFLLAAILALALILLFLFAFNGW